MATLIELIEYVRVQTQTREDELPSTTIEWHLQQGFDRTIAANNKWPFFEQTWEVTQVAGDTTALMPGNAHGPGVLGLFSADSQRIEMMDHTIAQERYGQGVTTSGGPVNFSLWAGNIWLWPQSVHEADQKYALHGYRKAVDWIVAGPAASPDCDERLHLAIANYAIAMAYEQQEDEVLGSQYMQRWQHDVEMVTAAILEPSQDQPLVFGPHGATSIGRGASSRTIVTGINPKGPRGEMGPAGSIGPPGPSGVTPNWWTGTQAEYDALGSWDSDTQFWIVG